MNMCKLICMYIFMFISLGYSISSRYAYVVVSPKAILRQSASAHSKQILELSYGTKVEILEDQGPEDMLLGTNGNWYKIRVNGFEGWIFNRLLESSIQSKKIVSNGQLVPESWRLMKSPSIGMAEYFVYLRTGLPIFESPNVTSKKVFNVRFAEKVELLGEATPENYLKSNGGNKLWLKIKFKQVTGFVWARGIGKLPPPPEKCESLSHYLHAKVKPSREIAITRLKPYKWQRTGVYENQITYDEVYAMDDNEEKILLTLDLITDPFYVVRLCTWLFQDVDAQYDENREIHLCKNEDEGVTSGHEELIVSNRSSDNYQITLTRVAHGPCKK